MNDPCDFLVRHFPRTALAMFLMMLEPSPVSAATFSFVDAF